ncbi:hypothetical protein CHS0354_030430 [Potamilus streckersoni]|uniref:G-protein coupled receptors family 1 profile domain-containing protein n=1 Tax=Potamilus streckersoni TaxID=2493646 RepID=A0AAE0S905_9BIVA|nr:hypothetical protein CHS0354_030430 [Potamilus streckersoni]
MVVLFIIAWTPYAVITVWNIFYKPVDSNVQVLPTMFAKISCASNPIIHGFLSDRFRESARRLFLKKPQGQRNQSERNINDNNRQILMGPSRNILHDDVNTVENMER